MASISINGINIQSMTAGRSIIINNGKVIVDGQDVTPDSKTITIEVTGNVDKLSVDACSKIAINGDSGSIKTQSGDVEVGGQVSGSIQTMSGDVDCGNVLGNISTMSGDVKHRKS